MVAVDGSPSSLLAFRWVLDRAKPGQDHVYLTHFYRAQVHPLQVPFVSANFGKLMEQHLCAQGKVLLKRLRRKLKKRNIESTLLLVRGEAKKKIPIMAEKRGVDMVVVGQRGLSKVKRLYVGSVSQYVAEHAPCAVCVVREDKGKPGKSSLRSSTPKVLKAAT